MRFLHCTKNFCALVEFAIRKRSPFTLEIFLIPTSEVNASKILGSLPSGRNDGWERAGDFKITKPCFRHFDQKKCLFIHPTLLNARR